MLGKINQLVVFSLIYTNTTGAGDMHTMVEANLRKSAAAIMDRAKELCQKRSVNSFYSDSCQCISIPTHLAKEPYKLIFKVSWGTKFDQTR